MKVAIVGSNSFLASYITLELINNGCYVTHFGTEPSKDFTALSFNKFQLPDYQLNLEQLINFDAVIYTAGAGIQSNLEESSDLIYELNCFTPIRIVNYLKEKKYQGKFISFGSYFEIGNETTAKSYNETEIVTTALNVPNHYCTSKRMLTRFYDSCPNLSNFYHFILPNIYGKGENPTRLIPYLLNALQNNLEIKLTSGEQVRQFIHAIDISKMVVDVIQNKYPFGIYNLCNPTPIKIKELVKEIYELTGNSHLFSENIFGSNTRTDTHMPFLLLDNSKISSIFKYQPMIGIKEGIKMYL